MTGISGLTWPVPPWRVPRRPWVRAAALELLVVGGTLAVESGGHAGRLTRQTDAAGYALLALAAGATGLAGWSPLGALGITLAAALAYVGRGGSEHGPLVLAVMAALYAAVRPERPWRTIAIGAATLLGFHAVGLASPAAGAHTVGAASSGAGELVASLVNRSWIAVPLVLGHAVASARANRAAAEERARLAEQTREEHAQRRVAEERLRIARELHDVVSHSISVINLQAGVAAHVMDERPEQARQALLTIKATSKEALGELRGILGLLRQGDEGGEAEPRAPAPGLDQVGALVEATSRVGVPTRLSVDGPARPLPPAVELAAYRIVQESLANVLRHAGAASAAVTLRYEDDRLALEVADDGRGQSPTGAWPASGSGRGRSSGNSLGIAGMRERAAAVGGELEVGPRPEGGFRVRAWLPAPRDASGASEVP